VKKRAERAVEIFWSRVEITASCWYWRGSCDIDGYGQFGINKKTWKAHRFAYETMIGSIPLGYEPHHTCNNPGCVNPDHLEVVTRREHILKNRSWGVATWNLNKTHCPKGHPYDEDNTYHEPGGGRGCRICRKEATRRYLANKKKLFEDTYGIKIGII
jgi:hypothetical protein